jgi:uncharacterized repeat protein (TIGR03806 family)
MVARAVLALLLVVGMAYADDPGDGVSRRRPGPTRALSSLRLPPDDRGEIPTVLSKTGVFRDVRTLEPAPGLIPYSLNVPFWSDGAEKRRWMALPAGRSGGVATIRFAATGEWAFPEGTVFIKHFELAEDEARPDARRRLETRLLVRTGPAGVYGISYKWRADNSDADLVRDGQPEAIKARTGSGLRARRWYYPGPADCRQCHTLAAGGVLGVNARQLNGDFKGASGVEENQLRAWNRLGLFDPPLVEAEIPRLDHLAAGDALGRSLEDRARSYLDANCAYCHRPGGVPADFDARYDTLMAARRLLGAPVRIDLGVDGARAIAPNDPWRSAILTRMQMTGTTGMPPLAHEVIDDRAVAMVRAWITSLPGPSVLEPPTIEAKGGDDRRSIRVTLAHPDPGALIRYTLDGTAPSKSSRAYTGPLAVDRPATLRARAYKPGTIRSIIIQETWTVED